MQADDAYYVWMHVFVCYFYSSLGPLYMYVYTCYISMVAGPNFSFSCTNDFWQLQSGFYSSGKLTFLIKK